jgi:hypothetical protein
MLAYKAMRWLLNLVITLAVVAGAVYVLFFIDFGGQNLASHLGEIWRSPVVQRKVDVVEKSLEKKLADKLTQARAQSATDAPGPGQRTGRYDDHISEHDRKSLNDLVGQIAHSTN